MTNLETTQIIQKPAIEKTTRENNFFFHLFLLTRRTLVSIFRTPESILPPIGISLFFLVIYESTLGRAAGFLPNIGGSYLGFILPLSIISSSLSGAGIAAQNLVREHRLSGG